MDKLKQNLVKDSRQGKTQEQIFHKKKTSVHTLVTKMYSFFKGHKDERYETWKTQNAGQIKRNGTMRRKTQNDHKVHQTAV